MTEPRSVIAHPLLSRMPTTPNEWAEYNRVLLDLFNGQQRRIDDLESRVNALENPLMGFLSDIVDSITGRSQREAAETVAQGNEAAIAEIRRQFDTGVDLTATQRGLQDAAATSLQGLLMPADGDRTAALRNLPGYQFAVNETMRNANAGAAGRGQFFSGAAGQALQGRLYGLADQNFGSEVNRLLAAANGGQAAQAQAAAGQNAGAQIGSLMANTGAARASGILGQSNQINSILNGGIRAIGGFGG